MKKKDKNPFATKDGGPQPGKTKEWDDWSKEQYLQVFGVYPLTDAGNGPLPTNPFNAVRMQKPETFTVMKNTNAGCRS